MDSLVNKSLFLILSKIISEGESKFSEQNNESVITCPIEYSLSWMTKSN